MVESPLENYRLRKCLIYYYLSDNTFHVTEPPVENSQIPQGIFIKRQRIPKKVGLQEFYNWQDLNLGININFFERYFRITDCDEFTRRFYGDMSVQLNNPEEMPLDNYELY